MESEPDRFFRRYKNALISQNVELIAKFLGADPKNLVFVSNTTTGTHVTEFEEDTCNDVLCSKMLTA